MKQITRKNFKIVYASDIDGEVFWMHINTCQGRILEMVGEVTRVGHIITFENVDKDAEKLLAAYAKKTHGSLREVLN